MPWHTEETPIIEARRSGETTVCIDYFQVPEGMQRQGTGTDFYLEWEFNLPKNIKRIVLHAVSDEGEDVSEFWKKLGFVPSGPEGEMTKVLKKTPITNKNTKGAKALLVMHLSSLDSYSSQFGIDEGERIGYAIEEAIEYHIESHGGPIIIIDQFWSLHGRDSRPRELVYDAIERIPENRIVIIRHDECDSANAWSDLFEELLPLLNELGVEAIRIGGFWYDPEEDSGCAWYVGQWLSEAFDVRYDEEILGREFPVSTTT